MNDRIPMPSPAERDASIQRILDRGLPPARPGWRHLPLSALVFGVEDCLFLAVLLALLPLGLVFLPAGNLSERLPAVLFATSPLLYAAAHGLALWKETLSGTMDWKRTCRLSLQVLMALRMLLFGGAALLACVPVNLLLWQASGCGLALSQVLGISFASLFLYAALSLACRRLRWGGLVPPALWALANLAVLFWCPQCLSEVPAALFFLLAGAGLLYFLFRLRAMLRHPNKGDDTYAFS